MSQPDAVPFNPPYQPAPVVPYRLGGLATALTILFSVMVLALSVNAVALFRRAAWVDGWLSGAEEFTDKKAASIDNMVVGTGIGYLLIALPLGVVFIIWQWRHAKNAQLLGSYRKLGPGWAIGGWFIPFANWILPGMQIFGATRYSHADRSSPVAEGSGLSLVAWWAVAFAVGSIVTRVAVGMMTDETSPTFAEDLVASDRVEAGGTLVLIAAALLGIAMVRKASSRQEVALKAFVTQQNQYATW